ncbi:thioesterase family protein [Nocardioides rubriscoriae]|uniref:thioesterase family protein n=1 Tax=Nocardioides rubriscoriae TaxID=642762 RepID=UPI0011DFDBFA|nr:thioesterase family protein [Nocardioides rubriscoriae]
MTSLPTLDQVRSLPAYYGMTVPDDYIDQNGHMNISRYFELGAWAPWRRLEEMGADDSYIPERGLSFFTVEHHIRYLAELRLGEAFSVRPAIVARTGKAVHGISFVVDEGRDRIVCTMELLWVHVSMQARRAAPIPDDVAAALDGEIAQRAWARDAATGLTLRRPA